LDDQKNTHREYVTEVKSVDLTRFNIEQIEKIEGGASQKELSFGIFAFSGDAFDDMVFVVIQTGTDLGSFLEKVLKNEDIITEQQKSMFTLPTTKAYLTIVNTSPSELEFSLTSKELFALSDSNISVQAHYGDTEVGLEAKFSEPFPNFLQGIFFEDSTSSP
jgi:hypothetical protein